MVACWLIYDSVDLLYLLYSRFFTKALHLEDIKEPFQSLFTQGMVCHNTYQNEEKTWVFPDDVEKKNNTFIQISTGQKVIEGPIESMSKSKKNVIDPQSIIQTYGADSARWFMLSDSPPEKDINWSESGINGSWKICQKIWSLVSKNKEYLQLKNKVSNPVFSPEATSLLRSVHQNLNAITQGIEKFQMNVAIARVFEMVNTISKFKVEKENDNYAILESLKILIRVIEPLIPHLAEECWSYTDDEHSLSLMPWPNINEKYLETNNVIIVVQINGKRRGEVLMKKDATEDMVHEEIKKIKNIKDALNGKNILKSIYVPNRILNIVLSS